MKRRLMGMLAIVLLAVSSWHGAGFRWQEGSCRAHAEEYPAGAALARRPSRPGQRKGSWEPPGVGDMAGTGGGFAGTAQPEKKIDVPFLPWAKAAYDQRNANVTKDDPEGFCLPSGIPRMYATSFPFQIYQMPNRILFVFEGGAHMWRVVYMDGRKHTPAGQAKSHLPGRRDRPLGRRHAGGRRHRIKRPKLDRRGGTSAHRTAPRHRALHARE